MRCDVDDVFWTRRRFERVECVRVCVRKRCDEARAFVPETQRQKHVARRVCAPQPAEITTSRTEQGAMSVDAATATATAAAECLFLCT